MKKSVEQHSEKVSEIKVEKVLGTDVSFQFSQKKDEGEREKENTNLFNQKKMLCFQTRNSL